MNAQILQYQESRPVYTIRYQQSPRPALDYSFDSNFACFCRRSPSPIRAGSNLATQAACGQRFGLRRNDSMSAVSSPGISHTGKFTNGTLDDSAPRARAGASTTKFQTRLLHLHCSSRRPCECDGGRRARQNHRADFCRRRSR